MHGLTILQLNDTNSCNNKPVTPNKIKPHIEKAFMLQLNDTNSCNTRNLAVAIRFYYPHIKIHVQPTS